MREIKHALSSSTDGAFVFAQPDVQEMVPVSFMTWSQSSVTLSGMTTCSSMAMPALIAFDKINNTSIFNEL